jgi:hypothetical protein
MSYQKKTRFGQYIAVAGFGDDEKCADGSTPGIWGCTDTGATTEPSFFDKLFSGSSTPAKPATPSGPSTTSQVGAGIGAFLAALGKPATPVLPAGMPITYAQPGMSTTTKLALAGGGALVLVLLLTRD